MSDAGPGAEGGSIDVRIAWSPDPGRAFEAVIAVRGGATVAEALAASGLFERHPALTQPEPRVGVWGRRCGLDRPLQAGDRVELYRPLQIDPMTARQQRAERQQHKRAPVRKMRAGV